MVLRPPARFGVICRETLLASLLVTGAGCVAVDEVTSLAALERASNETVRLPEAEHMIDDLDRVMTAFGTISIKTPDVWGQDRLAKFRSEYESQMAGWLKQGFRSDINASVRRIESEATRVMVGANEVAPVPNNSTAAATTPPAGVNIESMVKTQAALESGACGFGDSAGQDPGRPRANGRARRALELSEPPEPVAPHQCGRRPDRPARLRALLDPHSGNPRTGPRSRRGKGAIITVSAKSVMTKHTLRNALRNAVINETVTNLTQAITSHSGENGDHGSGRGDGSFSLLSFADTELYHGADNIALLKTEARAPASQ